MLQAHARDRNRQSPARGGGGRGPVRAPREAPPTAEAARGNGCARTGPSPPPPPFCFLGTMGKLTAERGSTRLTREEWARAGAGPGGGGSAGRLRPCHGCSLAKPALSGRTDGGGGEAGARAWPPPRPDATSSASRFSDRSRRPPARAHRGLPSHAVRTGLLKVSCNGEKRRRSRGRGRAGGRAPGRCEARDRPGPAPSPLRCRSTQAQPGKEGGTKRAGALVTCQET